MSDFLLELLSEEIPARMQAKARADLARLFAESLQSAGLATEGIETFSTPRRLVLIARGLPDKTEHVVEEVKGPRVGAAPNAIEGFLRRHALHQENLVDRDGTYYAIIEIAGRPTGELLGEAVERIVRDFPWPKSMRWGAGSLRWVRPLHGIVALLGEDIVPVEVDGIKAGAATVGHRFHHPGVITIGSVSDYAEKLRACHVIVDHEEREAIIRDGAAKAAKAAKLTLVEDEWLVVENAGLTEWPVPLLGRFDPDFLDVPREVIVLTMRTNQKYFACTNGGGALAPAFVCVANVDANDGGEAIVEGNRRVLAARLADARFFWEQDLKVPLEEQGKKLSGIVFHENLGTVADKVERVAKLARWLVEERIVKADAEQVERAARLAKADLVTGMVGEFPELQGMIGGYIADRQGDPKPISLAIWDHYKPIGQSDLVPTAPSSVAVALAEKIDTVVSFNLAKEFATGSKDPYGLRRAALGFIRIILENKLRLSLRTFIMQAWQAAVISWNKTIADPNRRDAVETFLKANAQEMPEHHWATFIASARPDFMDDVQGNSFKLSEEFIIDRLKVQQREAGVRHDLIDAVFALGGEDDLVRLLARVNALQAFVETGEGGDLLTAYKRAANILKKEKWDAAAASKGEAPAEERALVAALDKAEPKAKSAVDKEDFTAAMAALASLRAPIDAFFDKVTVNDPDKAARARRLNLLARFRDAVHEVADFSKIEG